MLQALHVSGDEIWTQQRSGGGARGGARAAAAAPTVRSARSPIAVCPFSLFVPHFRYFVLEFKLVDSKELSPLQELIDSMMGRDKQKLMGAYAHRKRRRRRIGGLR